MKWSALPIILMIYLEIVNGIVFKKNDQHALIHIVAYKQVEKLL